MTEDQIYDFLEQNYGTVHKIKLVLDERGRSKGFAFVEFTGQEGYKKALDAREFKLGGRLALIKSSERQITEQK